METLKVLKKFDGKTLNDYPEITYSTLYKRVFDNVYFEFMDNDNGYLFSPLFTLLRGEAPQDLLEFIDSNEALLGSLKGFIINSLFLYSAIIEENSYHLTNPQSMMLMRLVHLGESKFEVKFYTHFKDELLNSYEDKIYLGRDFVNLDNFDREYLGLKNNFLSLTDQNKKIQERAKQKLRYFDDYKKPYLDEIAYLTKETASDTLERVKLLPYSRIADIPRVKLNGILDNILYIQNLMIELKDFINEFEDKLRLGAENNFVKYLIKFQKDIKDDIRYLRKLSFYIHLKLSNFPI